MAAIGYMMSALMMGVVLVALVATLARGRQWRTPPTGEGGEARAESIAATVAEMARTPLAWTVGFLVLALVFGTATVAFVAGGVPSAIAQGVGIAVALLFASVLGTYVLWGVYHSVRNRDVPNAQAAMVSLWVVGLLLIGVVVVQLVTAS